MRIALRAALFGHSQGRQFELGDMLADFEIILNFLLDLPLSREGLILDDVVSQPLILLLDLAHHLFAVGSLYSVLDGDFWKLVPGWLWKLAHFPLRYQNQFI